MKRWGLVAIAAVFLFGFLLLIETPLYAFPNLGDDCLTCHTEGGVTLSSNTTGIIKVLNASAFGVLVMVEGQSEETTLIWSKVASNPLFAFTPSQVTDNGASDENPAVGQIAARFQVIAPETPGAYTIQVFGADSGGKGATLVITVNVKVEGQEENLFPSAHFLHSRNGMTFNFTDRSWDLDGTIVSWNWDFGDNTSSSEQNPSHKFAEQGTYTVSLTVVDDKGGSNTRFLTFMLPTSEERLRVWTFQIAVGSIVLVVSVLLIAAILGKRKK